MTASIEFFPVGNGDMTLIRLATGRTILIDINIRNDADDQNKHDYPDVAKMLKDRLERDADNDNRLYVDAFVLTHPDQDHCGGLQNHYHLGAPSTWKKPEGEELEKILIHEMWSAPLTFRRADRVDGNLVPNAEAWKKEAKRRVKLAKDGEASANELGNLIKIMGEDVHHDKTEGIEHLIQKVGESTNTICGQADPSFSALLLSPKVVTEEEADALPGKNNSSIVMQFSFSPSDSTLDKKTATRFLTGGDAEINIWKRIWHRNEETTQNLAYHILQTPHHCSLGALSYDNYNDQAGKQGKGEECDIDKEAYSALSQAETAAYIVASSEEPAEKSGKDLAKRLYEAIAENANGKFLGTMTDSKDEPLKLEITERGPESPRKKGPIPAVPPKTQKGTTEKSYARFTTRL